MSKRYRYLVCYDIADSKRLRRTAKICESYGTRIQFSVFEASLDHLALARLKVELDDVLNHADDQVLFVNLGLDDSSTPFSMESIGMPYVKKSRLTII
ncbi:MAG: CRISPR-associated endonuclease Cas2 [Akkermansia sp.]|nr:CRISPR-associated endonuclease Cas2 [Akkermansia sp.]